MAEPVPASNTSALPPPPEALPPTTNPQLLAQGSLSLYNSILFLASAAVLQHFIVFGIAALLRGFSPKRTLDLHYLTFFFAISLAAAPAVFLLDLKIDQMKLLFFLEHEAIEYLILVRVVAPPSFVKRWSGMILFVAWTLLFCVTTVIVLDQFHHKAAMIAAWGAFTSDFSVGIAGVVLVYRWIVSTERSKFGIRRIRAEGLAGIGFMTHGELGFPLLCCLIESAFMLMKALYRIHDDVCPADLHLRLVRKDASRLVRVRVGGSLDFRVLCNCVLYPGRGIVLLQYQLVLWATETGLSRASRVAGRVGFGSRQKQENA